MTDTRYNQGLAVRREFLGGGYVEQAAVRDGLAERLPPSAGRVALGQSRVIAKPS
jgi:hypothetical protein